VLLRSVNGQPIKESDVVRLIDIIKANLLSTEVSSAVFSLIKALLSQKYLIPEIYELMDQIGELLVTSHSSNVRELSRQTLLIFLMEYPLTARVLQQRVAFLIKNLSYTHEYGRHSAVTMLHSLIDNFPEETFNQYASLIFVALLVRLDNESPSSVCFVAIESALKALIGGFFDRNAYTKIFTIVKKMFASDMASKIIACHVTGLIFERFLTSEKTDANNGHSETLFDLLLTVLKTSNNHADTTTIIKALESLLVGVENFPSFCDAEEKIYNLLTIVMGVNAGPHSVISCRILFALLSKIADMKISTYNSDLPLIQIAYSAFEAIKANDITETDGLEFIKLLFALFKVAKNHPALFSNEGALDAKPKNHMGWLIQKMSYLARSQQKNHGVILPRSLIYRWFASVIDFPTGEELIGYSMKIMFPMYRTILDTTTVGQGFEDLKLLAQEILLLFEKKIGSPEFVKISSNINRRIEEVRNDRRVQRKQQVVANPQSSAKRKIERNLMKRAGRKRKIDGRRSMRV
jgi:U3 small nucleolar RNA-associated protein 20